MLFFTCDLNAAIYFVCVSVKPPFTISQLAFRLIFKCYCLLLRALYGYGMCPPPFGMTWPVWNFLPTEIRHMRSPVSLKNTLLILSLWETVQGMPAAVRAPGPGYVLRRKSGGISARFKCLLLNSLAVYYRCHTDKCIFAHDICHLYDGKANCITHECVAVNNLLSLSSQAAAPLSTFHLAV